MVAATARLRTTNHHHPGALFAMTCRLMIPSPVPLSESVAEAIAAPVKTQYCPAWVSIHNETLQLLRQAFVTEGDVFILVGPGSAGLDADIGGLVAPGEGVLYSQTRDGLIKLIMDTAEDISARLG